MPSGRPSEAQADVSLGRLSDPRTPSSPSEFLRQLRLMHRQVVGADDRAHALEQARERALEQARAAMEDDNDMEEPCPVGPSGELSESEECGDDLDDEDAWDVAEVEALHRERQCLTSSLSSTLRPEPCSLLLPGQTFHGRQSLATAAGRPAEQWQVEVRIQAYDPVRGYICGVMEALNVPQARCPVVTFWEGEIVDNVNHTFLTRKWGAERSTDVQHWSKFEGYGPLRRAAERNSGHAPGLATCPFIFMRWKEQFFVTSADFGLTIAGFYYVCMNRADGKLLGYYFDEHSAPFQELSVCPKRTGGAAFSSYELC